MNVVILKGRLTADPEIKTATSGATFANFSIAIDRPPDKNGDKACDFIRCTAFNKTAEFLGRYFGKGKEILAEGTLQQNDYQDKDGVQHKSYKVIVNRVEFCGSKSDSNGGAPAQNNGWGAPAAQNNGGWGNTPPPQNNGWNAPAQAQPAQAYAQPQQPPVQQMPPQYPGNPMGYQISPQQPMNQPPAQPTAQQVSAFEQVLSDGDCPF
jgi:single-strand DNA-binding protein